MEKFEITVERVPHNGHLKLSTVMYGRLLHQLYIGHTLREAKELFKQFVKEQSPK